MYHSFIKGYKKFDYFLMFIKFKMNAFIGLILFIIFLLAITVLLYIVFEELEDEYNHRKAFDRGKRRKR